MSFLQTTSLSQCCPSPAPFIYSQWKVFLNKVHLSSPSSTPEQWMCLSSSSIAGGLDRMSQNLVLFLVRIWLNKSCLLGELSTSKVFCCLRGNILWLPNMIQSGDSTCLIQRRYSIWDKNLGSGTKMPRFLLLRIFLSASFLIY